MRERLFTPCIIILFFLLLFSQMDVGAETGGKIPEWDPLSYMPKDITLGDALRKYPEIQDYYPLKVLSKEETEAYIAKGVRVISDINADDILAIPFLEQINHVSYPSDTSSDTVRAGGPGHPLLPLRGNSPCDTPAPTTPCHLPQREGIAR